MTKKQMVRILKDEFGKTDSECKLGHWCEPYSKLVLKSQKGKGKGKGKRKFVKPPVDLTLVDLEAMVVDWKKNGVLLLTNKAGDFMMKSGHVRAMYEYIEHTNAVAMAQAATAKGGGDSECGKGGGSGDIEEPFMGDADTSPDYVGMIKYLYEDKLKSMRILLLKKVYFAKRGVFWLRIIAMMREFFARQAKAASSNKNLKIYSTNLFKEVCGMKGGWDMTKWYAISILVSPTKTEEIFQEHKQALTGTNALNAVRNCLADVYAANKEDLGAVSYGFPENFVSDFQAMLGIDIWKAVKTHYETSAAYEDYAKEIEENE
eukprot:65009_1